MAKKSALARAAKQPAPQAAAPSPWPAVAAVAAALIAVWWAYAPAFSGPFLFDDQTLPFALTAIAAAPLIVWMHSDRPVLMFTYWMNARISGADPYSYHVFNVVIHCIAGGLVFLIVRRFLEWSGVEARNRN